MEDESDEEEAPKPAAKKAKPAPKKKATKAKAEEDEEDSEKEDSVPSGSKRKVGFPVSQLTYSLYLTWVLISVRLLILIRKLPSMSLSPFKFNVDC